MISRLVSGTRRRSRSKSSSISLSQANSRLTKIFELKRRPKRAALFLLQKVGRRCVASVVWRIHRVVDILVRPHPRKFVRSNSDMTNKVAVVTGASSGIGRATAHIFAKNGIDVVAVGRNQAELDNLRDETRDFEGSIRVSVSDVTVMTQVDRLISETIDHFGHLDV